ncbi:hypothetical protein [Simplicispira metamorpha]|uniref:hypothetical protein n=1 Tax=Simplicispira metamorpha TaxID=80881 RepID=UPI0013005C30|nr:hypothetical protein [Simplicispira metamorpha]
MFPDLFPGFAFVPRFWDSCSSMFLCYFFCSLILLGCRPFATATTKRSSHGGRLALVEVVGAMPCAFAVKSKGVAFCRMHPVNLGDGSDLKSSPLPSRAESSAVVPAFASSTVNGQWSVSMAQF